jgi:prephenate dehydrogenase
MKDREKLVVHVVGTGLIGTSIALAAREHGHVVSVEDQNPHHEALAMDLLKISLDIAPSELESVQIVVVAVPPKAVAEVVSASLRQYPNAIVIDVASVKTKLVNEVSSLSDKFSRYIPTHPIAGRQYEGPASAQADLFLDRPWILIPRPGNSPSDLSLLSSFIEELGASVQQMTSEHHDFLFARISHMPQIVSTVLGAGLIDIGAEVAYAGQGLRDVTRLAESKSELWSEIISMNRAEISDALQEFSNRLAIVAQAISDDNEESISTLFKSGNKGRTFFAGKHGGKIRNYVYFRIVIEDRPGALGDLFLLCGKRGINVEDLSIEHSPRQETGLITLAVSPEQGDKFQEALTEAQWKFHVEKKDPIGS